MIVRDWRDVPADVLTPLYASESGRWRDRLRWDMSGSWSTVEEARTTWGLPGLVCVSPTGDIRGWTFYMVADGRLDVGGLTADTPEVTAALVDALIARAGSPAHLQGFLYASAPDAAPILTRRSVPLMTYSYRMRAIDDTSATPAGRLRSAVLSDARADLRGWSDGDIDAAADLLSEVYGNTAGLVKPNATRQDWREYVGNLVLHGGCGTLAPAMSHVLQVDGRIAAMSLVSVIAPQTAHLVQLAVRGDLQHRGIGRALLEASLSAAKTQGHTAMSLLVSEQSLSAVRLYQAAGFQETGTFVALRAVGAERTVAPAASHVA